MADRAGAARRREEPAPEAASLRTRTFWSGTLTFGLVAIPVAILPANRARGVSLRMLGPRGAPLARRYYEPATGRELPRSEVVRGYEVEEGRYVVVSDEELEALSPEKSRDIALERFVPADRIDPLFFQRAYFLTPSGESTRAYRLLAEVMERRARAGIATFVMRGKEYLVAILAENGILRAETLRFADEVRSPEDVGLPARRKASPHAVRRLQKAIEKLAADTLDPEELRDRAAQRLEQLVERKREAGEDVVEAPGAAEGFEGRDIPDLMNVLKWSLEKGGRGRSAPANARAETAGAEAEDLAELGKRDLYALAQERDVAGRSSMTKAELVAALRASG